MRDFKFRAWDTETKEMSYDFLNKNWLLVCIESPYVELMQYTGLKDKNGKEIYEGDVLECTCESLTNFGRTRTGKFTTTYYEILWHEEGWGKKVLKSELLVVGKVSDGVAITAKYSEVIGNIYEDGEPHA